MFGNHLIRLLALHFSKIRRSGLEVRIHFQQHYKTTVNICCSYSIENYLLDNTVVYSLTFASDSCLMCDYVRVINFRIIIIIILLRNLSILTDMPCFTLTRVDLDIEKLM